MSVAPQRPRTARRLSAPTGIRRSTRNPIPAGWRIPLACAAVAMATACLAVLATVSVADWNVTVLVRMAAEEPIAPLARETDPDFAFVHYHGRGDGVSYYAIARDPLARGDEHDLIQWPAYRYGHPGYSWLARADRLRERRALADRASSPQPDRHGCRGREPPRSWRASSATPRGEVSWSP